MKVRPYCTYSTITFRLCSLQFSWLRFDLADGQDPWLRKLFNGLFHLRQLCRYKLFTQSSSYLTLKVFFETSISWCKCCGCFNLILAITDFYIRQRLYCGSDDFIFSVKKKVRKFKTIIVLHSIFVIILPKFPSSRKIYLLPLNLTKWLRMIIQLYREKFKQSFNTTKMSRYLIISMWRHTSSSGELHFCWPLIMLMTVGRKMTLSIEGISSLSFRPALLHHFITALEFSWWGCLSSHRNIDISIHTHCVEWIFKHFSLLFY